MKVWTNLLACLLVIFSFNTFARADDDDGWESESGWEDLDDGKNPAKEKEQAMAMGPTSLPAGDVAVRLSAGFAMSQLGVHIGVLDRLDLIAEAALPWTDLGNTWIAGGGMKVMAFGKPGGFKYTFKLKAFYVMYSDADSASGYLPEGLALWPSFMVGMKVKGGCFYGELGAFLFPYTSAGSNRHDVFMGIPAHFGGEIYATDWFHIFINVDLVLASPIAFFTAAFIGPFNIIEAGVVFIL